MKPVRTKTGSSLAQGSASSANAQGSSGAAGSDVPSLKVVIVGDYGVGKTSLIRQLTQRQFLTNSGTTIGVEFKEHRFPNAVLQIWDIAGQQYMSSMTRQYYRWASAAIVCVDVTKDSTFEVALDWRRDVMEKVGCAAVATMTTLSASASPNASPARSDTASSPPGKRLSAGDASAATSSSPALQQGASQECSIPIFLFVNKSDLLAQTTRTAESLQMFALEHGFTDMVMTSAKDYNNVLQAFQHVATFVVEIQESQGLEGTKSAAGSTVNLNALRRSIRPGPEADKGRKKKECCS